MTPDEKHPITAALIALIGVGLAIGLLLGVITLVVSRVAGLGGDDGSKASGAGPSLYLPTPVPTDSASDSPAEEPAAGASEPARPAHTKTAAAEQITLQAGASSVDPMERIDLSGVYTGGEGAVLQVQRKGSDGGWEDFPVTTAVAGETFSTYVQTGRSGVQHFRVRDSDAKLVSNVVSVTVR